MLIIHVLPEGQAVKLTFFAPCCSVQSRLHFCIIDVEYFNLTQNKIIVESYWCKKNYVVYKYFQSSRLRIKEKKKVYLRAWNECAKWLSFQTTCLRVVFCVRCSRQFRKRLEHTIRRRAYNQFTLHFLTDLFFRFHFIMKQKQKLISSLMQKRMVVESFDVISI